MSKHAIEAFSDMLAAEMALLGVQVSIVEPGHYNSEISKSAAKRAGAPWLGDRSRYKEPDEVAAIVLQALSEANPKRRYMITPNQREAEITIRKAIEVLVQLNEGQQYTSDRDALVKLLDESLATATPKTPAPIIAPPTTKDSKWKCLRIRGLLRTGGVIECSRRGARRNDFVEQGSPAVTDHRALWYLC